MTNNKKYFRSGIFHCLEKNSTIIPDYYKDGLMVLEDGYIVEVGPYEKLKQKLAQDVTITHFKNSLIMPGFIDVHIHYPQYKIIGSYGETLLDWLNKYTFVEEQKFFDISYGQKIANLFFDELIKNGTTTAMSFCTSHKNSVEAFFNEAKKRNLRMIAGKVMMDRNAPDKLRDNVKSSVNDSRLLIEKWHNNARLSYAITPRFAITSTKEQLKQTGLLLKEYQNYHTTKGVLLQTHLNENIDEINFTKTLFPERKNYFDVYDYYDLTGTNSVFGHCIHNTKDELKRLADSNSKIAICPTSNLFLGNGLFNIKQLEKRKINFAFASDVGGGDSFSMLRVLNEAYKITHLQGAHLDPVKAFYLISLAAAKVLNMDDYLGNFEAKKEADFLVIDLKTNKLIAQKAATNINDILFNLMMLGDDRLIDKVFIMGDCAYQKAK